MSVLCRDTVFFFKAHLFKECHILEIKTEENNLDKIQNVVGTRFSEFLSFSLSH